MRSQKQNAHQTQRVKKFAPASATARDMGPRLLPVKEKAESPGDESRRHIKLANVALRKKTKHPEMKKKRSA
jgi:hypothetical protein